MAREKGVVKWFSPEKGYGFIRRESGDEVFVHHTDMDVEGFASLRNGETVEFEVFESDRGPRARKLVSLEPSDGTGKPDRGAHRSESRDERAPRADAGKGRARDARPERTSGRANRRSTTDRPKRGALKTLAENLREKLGGRYQGFGD